MKKTDDVVGKWNFRPLYRFILINYSKWETTQNEIIHIVDDPAMAYALYLQEKELDKGSVREILSDWVIYDSFNRDAFEFCKKAAENPIVDLTPPEETENK